MGFGLSKTLIGGNLFSRNLAIKLLTYPFFVCVVSYLSHPAASGPGCSQCSRFGASYLPRHHGHTPTRLRAATTLHKGCLQYLTAPTR